MTRKPNPLPDPWLFDSEALLRELDPLQRNSPADPNHPNATHFGIQLAVNAIYNLSENLRYILHLHREQQRAIRKQHDESLSAALAENAAATKANIVHLHTPTPENGKARQHHRDRQHAARENRRRRRTFSQPAA